MLVDGIGAEDGWAFGRGAGICGDRDAQQRGPFVRVQLVASKLREIVREQYDFRELLYQMTRRDLLLRYKQTIMGFGWAIFMPLVNTAVFSVIFTRVAPLDVDLPYPLFAYCGLLAWNFSASSFRFAVTSLTANASLVTKVYFPREIFPISAVLVSLVDFAVGATVLVAGPSFGVGSSREHAVWAIQQYGFVAVIAPSFSDIFRNNCTKNGLVPVVLPIEVVEQIWAAIEADPATEIVVDVERLVVEVPAAGIVAPFPMDAPTQHRFLEGLDDIGITLAHADEIDAYESSRPDWLRSTN